MSAYPAPAPAHLPRVLGVCVTGVLVAFLVQTAVLPAVGLSAAVPFTFATVAVLAVVLGSRTGALTGFGAGLLIDVSGLSVLGVGALLGSLLGAIAGQVHPDRWWFSRIPTVSGLVMLTAGAFTVVNAALQQVPIRFGVGWGWLIGGSVVSVILLMPTRQWLREVVR
jgi:rod shape-determining protein MreD